MNMESKGKESEGPESVGRANLPRKAFTSFVGEDYGIIVLTTQINFGRLKFNNSVGLRVGGGVIPKMDVEGEGILDYKKFTN